MTGRTAGQDGGSAGTRVLLGVGFTPDSPREAAEIACRLLQSGQLDGAAQAVERARAMLDAPYAAASDPERAAIEAVALRVAVARSDGGRVVGAANALHTSYPGTLPALEIAELRQVVEASSLREDLRSAVMRVVEAIPPLEKEAAGEPVRRDAGPPRLASDGLPEVSVEEAREGYEEDLPLLEIPDEDAELPYLAIPPVPLAEERGADGSRGRGRGMWGGASDTSGAAEGGAVGGPRDEGRRQDRGAGEGRAEAVPPLPESADEESRAGVWTGAKGEDGEVPDVPGRVVVAPGEPLEQVIGRFVQQHMDAAVEGARGACESAWSFFLMEQYEPAVLLFEEALRDPEVRLSAAEGAMRSYLAMGNGAKAVEFVGRLERVLYDHGLPELLMYWRGRAAEATGDVRGARAAYQAVSRESYPDVAIRLQGLPR